MSKLRHFACVALGLLLACGAVGGIAAGSTFVVTEDELHPDVFPQVADSIRANLKGPNSPRGLTRAERQQVANALDRMEAMLEEDPVRHHSRIRILQSRVNATLTPRVARNDARSDVVCERVKLVGSRIPTTVCSNRSERQLNEHISEEEFSRIQRAQARGG